MTRTCCICKLETNGLVCNPYFQKWPKVVTFMEYANIEKPEPKVIDPWVKTRDDFPPIAKGIE